MRRKNAPTLRIAPKFAGAHISIVVSQPPMNSPSMYTCGIVGQFEYDLMPSRRSGSASTLKPLKLVPSALRICTTVFEKPHCGWSGTPFMKTTTLFAATSFSICACTLDSSPSAAYERTFGLKSSCMHSRRTPSEAARGSEATRPRSIIMVCVAIARFRVGRGLERRPKNPGPRFRPPKWRTYAQTVPRLI